MQMKETYLVSIKIYTLTLAGLKIEDVLVR